jgi:hypothetical protein
MAIHLASREMKVLAAAASAVSIAAYGGGNIRMRPRNPSKASRRNGWSIRH